MERTLSPGDRLLVDYRKAPRAGDVVVARFPDGAVVVKRAVVRRDDGWWLLSDNPSAGVDSRHRGAIPDSEIIGVVVALVWPHVRRVRRLLRPR